MKSYMQQITPINIYVRFISQPRSGVRDPEIKYGLQNLNNKFNNLHILRVLLELSLSVGTAQNICFLGFEKKIRQI